MPDLTPSAPVRPDPVRPGAQRAYQKGLKVIRLYFVEQRGDPAVWSIRARDVQDFLHWRAAHRLPGRPRVAKDADAAPRELPPPSRRTVAKDRTTLHILFAFAELMEWCEANPVRRVKPTKCDERDYVILDDTQYERLLTECAKSGPMLGLYALVLGKLDCGASRNACGSRGTT